MTRTMEIRSRVDHAQLKFNKRMYHFILPTIATIQGLVHLIKWPWSLYNDKGNNLSLGWNPLVCLFFLISVVAYLAGSYWYLIGLSLAVICSQIIIIKQWNEAKLGTVLNFILVLCLLNDISAWKYGINVYKEHTSVKDRADFNIPIDHQLRILPPNVQRWLDVSGGSYDARNTIEILQTGFMKLSPVDKWRNFEASQIYTINPPSFLWDCRLKYPPITIAALDEYKDGKGSMSINAQYLIRISHEAGKHIDEGTALRFLAEMVWFPQAALTSYVTWEAIDISHAKATIRQGDLTASGIFTFQSNGLMKTFDAERFGSFDGVSKKEHWHIDMYEQKLLGGIIIPTRCDVKWRLKNGDFTWLKLTVDSRN